MQGGQAVGHGLRTRYDVQRKGPQPYTIPHMIAHCAAISAYGKGQQLGMALVLFDGMQRCGLEPGSITYNAAVCAREEGKQLDMACKLLTT